MPQFKNKLDFVKIILFLCVCMCLHVGRHACMMLHVPYVCRCLHDFTCTMTRWVPAESKKDTGGCEPPCVGAKN